jgi:hypothetical protein
VIQESSEAADITTRPSIYVNPLRWFQGGTTTRICRSWNSISGLVLAEIFEHLRILWGAKETNNRIILYIFVS